MYVRSFFSKCCLFVINLSLHEFINYELPLKKSKKNNNKLFFIDPLYKIIYSKIISLNYTIVEEYT